MCNFIGKTDEKVLLSAVHVISDRAGENAALLEKRTDQCRFAPSEKKTMFSHMMKFLLTELGRIGQENIWLSIRTS